MPDILSDAELLNPLDRTIIDAAPSGPPPYAGQFKRYRAAKMKF